MRKRLILLTIAIALSLGISSNLAALSTYACECSCSMGCGNHCTALLTNCGFLEGLEAAATCCDQAHQAVGDTGPCPGGNES